MPRKNALISYAFNPEANAIVFTVGEGAGEIRLPMSAESKSLGEIDHHALVHGYGQKVSDAAAIPKADLPKDAKKAALVKFDAMKAVADRLISGEWRAKSGDGTGPVQGLIFRAYAEFVTAKFTAAKKPVPSDETIRKQYDAMERSAQLGLRNVPEIATIIERIKSERGTPETVDTSALLGELGLK